MTSAPGTIDACTHRECAHAADERVFTLPTVITFARTLGTVWLAMLGAHLDSLTLLVWALGIYWVGDMADGAVARLTDRETRTGAVLDIVCDRASAAVFYVGFAWYDPTMAVPVGIYLTEFMVVDLFLSLAFLAWPVSSPNYFYLVDRRLWLWNWSKPGKVLNSSLFAVFIVVTRDAWASGAVACTLLGLKILSMVWLSRLGLPVPSGCAKTLLGGRGSEDPPR